MHIGGLTLVEGPPPTMEEFLEQIRRRLHLVPRYRQKLAHTGARQRPPGVDRRPELQPRLPRPPHRAAGAGTLEQLQDLTARIFSQQLDRSKPLWEMWLIEGLEDDRFALITKTHHSLIDGIAGVDLATVLFDLSPDPPPITQLRPAVEAASRTGHRAAARRGLRRARSRTGRRPRRGRARRARPPRARARARARSRRGRRRDRLGGAEPGPAKRR